MQKPIKPVDEAQRLQALRALSILDTLPEERFDRLTRLAKRLFGVPIALVSLVDDHRQWFKSRQGLEVSETPRDISFCGHAVLGDEIFIVPDASEDERFFDNPLVADDPHGNPLEFDMQGYEARAAQHEIDHLDGMLFVDRVVSRRADLFKRKVYQKGGKGKK